LFSRGKKLIFGYDEIPTFMAPKAQSACSLRDQTCISWGRARESNLLSQQVLEHSSL
jgi:hypothetical protein